MKLSVLQAMQQRVEGSFFCDIEIRELRLMPQAGQTLIHTEATSELGTHFEVVMLLPENDIMTPVSTLEGMRVFVGETVYQPENSQLRMAFLLWWQTEFPSAAMQLKALMSGLQPSDDEL